MIKKYWKKIPLIWRRFIKLFLFTFFLSLIITILLWKLFGRDLAIHLGYLSIDFFNTLCGVFTIVGFAIAIYQLAAIRREQEIRQETKHEVRKGIFIDEAKLEIPKILDAIYYLEYVILNETPYSETVITGFIQRISDIVKILQMLHNKQNSVNESTIPCSNCITLLSEIERVFYKSIDENDYISIKRQHIIIKLRDLTGIIYECQNALNK